MDKLEYIPGDLVFANGKLCKVVGYSFADSDLIRVYEYVHGSFGDTVSIVSISQDVHGIPLTPEILKKNGWKKSKINDCAYFYYKDGLFLTYTSKDGKFWFDDFDYSSSICVDLPYVHSLQHLFFGMGIKNEMEV